uniref:CHAP domain-containing protein n=1 Tax=Acrocarpospora macrocephala TaxID=150177 RepID=UPI0035A24C1C
MGYRVEHGQKSKYGAWYAEGTSAGFANAPWCDSFVSWAAGTAGVSKSVGKFAHTPDHQAWFKTQNAWATRPQPGAVAFLKKHAQVGIVEEAASGKVTTIEALHGKVQRVTRPESEFSGYGVPKQVQTPLFKGSTTASYFWDDGSGINGDTGSPASGKPMQKGLAASPSWPMGTEGYVIHNGRKADFFVGDRGPGVPSGSGVMLDLDGKTFAELTGSSWNSSNLTVSGGEGHIKIEYVITKWGSGLGKKGAPAPFSTGAYNMRDSSPPKPPTPKFPTPKVSEVTKICASTPDKSPVTTKKIANTETSADIGTSANTMTTVGTATPAIQNAANEIPTHELPIPGIAAALIVFAAATAGFRHYTRPRGRHRG